MAFVEDEALSAVPDDLIGAVISSVRGVGGGDSGGAEVAMVRLVSREIESPFEDRRFQIDMVLMCCSHPNDRRFQKRPC